MNIHHFIAPTSREALGKARHAFGDNTLILSNRQVVGGVEVAAMSEEPRTPGPDHDSPDTQEQDSASLSARAASSVAEDAADLAMSTLSFQQFVRERLVKKQQAETEKAGKKSDEPQAYMGAATPVVRHELSDASKTRPAQARPSRAKPAGEPAMTGDVVTALRDIRSLVEDRFSALAWQHRTQKAPILTDLSIKLLHSGYSPALTRQILENVPEGYKVHQGRRHVRGELTRLLTVEADFFKRSGRYSLVGTPGSGKTTAAAALATQCVQLHGQGSVGILTLDTSRPSAHDQLRHLTRNLGVPTYVAHDRQTLDDLLQMWSAKHMVIVDTAGVMLHDVQMLNNDPLVGHPALEKLLVLNASQHGEVLDRQLQTFSDVGIKGVVLSRKDETGKLAPALDSLMRYRVPLLGCTHGQAVESNWQTYSGSEWVGQSLHTTVDEHHVLDSSDAALMIQGGGAHLAS